MFQPGSNNYSVAFGTTPENVQVPTYQTRAPNSTDTNYPLGKRWLWIGNAEYVLLSLTTVSGILVANWSEPSGDEASGAVPGTVILGTLAELQA